MSIVHRDVKLENLVLRGKTMDEGVLLIDFGLAKQQTHATQLFYDEAGTVAYRAPEVGAAGYCPRKADVWSLGVTLFAWCHGQMPLREASANCSRFLRLHQQQAAGVKACDAILSSSSSTPPVASRSTLQTLRPLLDGMLEIDPRNRSSMRECAAWRDL